VKDTQDERSGGVRVIDGAHRRPIERTWSAHDDAGCRLSGALGCHVQQSTPCLHFPCRLAVTPNRRRRNPPRRRQQAWLLTSMRQARSRTERTHRVTDGDSSGPLGPVGVTCSLEMVAARVARKRTSAGPAVKTRRKEPSCGR
jgi:hypothetical protein